MISVIIPTHRRPEQLERCLYALKNLVVIGKLNCIIIMDGSCDETLKLADKYNFEGYHYLYGDGSLFWGGAISLGMNHAFNILNSERVIWLNDDSSFQTPIIERFIDELSVHDNYHVVGAMLFGSNVNRNIYDVKANCGFTQVKYLNGNFTSISKYAYQCAGDLNHHKFPHFADGPYLDCLQKLGFNLYCNTNIKVDIYYDVLRHLSTWKQVILRRDKFDFIRWSFFDIRSKWFLKYRYNYTINKFGYAGFIFFPAILLRDWLPVIFALLISCINHNKVKSILVNSRCLRNKLSVDEYESLKNELNYEEIK